MKSKRLVVCSSSLNASPRPFAFVSTTLHQLRALSAILLILGWVIPAWCLDLPRTHRRPIEGGKPKRVIYLAVGDSTGLGLGAHNGYGYVEQLMTRIRIEHPGSRLIKLCTLGETTTSLRQRLIDTLSIKPTFVTLSIGTNDLLQGITEQEFGANYTAIVERLRRFAVPIVITSLPDISFAPRLPTSVREEMHLRVLLFNKQIDAIAKHYGLFFVDLYTASAKTITKHPEFFASDGFHPSDAGYQFWTRIMWPTVKKAINRSKGSQHSHTLLNARAFAPR